MQRGARRGEDDLKIMMKERNINSIHDYDRELIVILKFYAFSQKINLFLNF